MADSQSSKRAAESGGEWVDDVGGHDVHFLRRLSRVSPTESDLALRLYRDPALVRTILTAFSGEEREPTMRLALALAAGEEPPHAVVSGDGKFITCLAARMDLVRLPVVPWSRVSKEVRASDELARSIKRFDEVAEFVGLEALLSRLHRAGGRMDRQTFAAMEAIAPIALESILTISVKAFGDLVVSAPATARLKGRSTADREDLRRWWNLLWCYTNSWMVMSTQAPVAFEHIEELGALSLLIKHWLFFIQIGLAPIALRFLWVFARGGRFVVGEVRRRLGAATGQREWIAAALALAAIAARNRRMAASIDGTFSPGNLPPDLRGTARGEALRKLIKAFIAHTIDGAEQTDPAGRQADDAGDPEDEPSDLPIIPESAIDGMKLLRGLDGIRKLGVEHVSSAEQTRAVMAHLFPLLANAEFDVCDLAGQVPEILLALKQLMRAKAQAFYALESETSALGVAFEPEKALGLARIWRPDPPARVDPKPGRNNPCACGSGKKSKRCCG